MTTTIEARLLKNEPLSKYTFTRTGGPADYLMFPQNVAEVQSALALAAEHDWPVTVIGNASNLIVKDGGIRGLTLILTSMKAMTYDEASGALTAEAGAKLIDTTEFAYTNGLTGLEFAAGIPGSVGGAAFMNAGAYDGEIADVVQSVTVLERDGKLRTLNHDELDFSYRHSSVQTSGAVILEVTFALKAGDPLAIREKMDHFNYLRASKQPLEFPSCGSVFKRPVGHFVGPMIQEAGIQGHVIGGAQISLKHAGFIVNVNHATASDYIDMIHFVQESIQKKFGIALEPEVRIIGQNLN